VAESDWLLDLKNRVKRNRRLATLVFQLTNLLYLNMAERRRFVGAFCLSGPAFAPRHPAS